MKVPQVERWCGLAPTIPTSKEGSQVEIEVMKG